MINLINFFKVGNLVSYIPVKEKDAFRLCFNDSLEIMPLY